MEKGTLDNPAVIKESVHHFYKQVSGKPLVRPAWFFDVNQQGSGLVDVTTHLVDLVQWTCFPDQILNYKTDVEMLDAERSATDITRHQFQQVTGLSDFPEFLRGDVTDSVLQVFQNGQMDYTLKGIHARVSVKWNFYAGEGRGDTHFSLLRGTLSNLVIRQGAEQNFKPVLFIEPVKGDAGYELALTAAVKKLNETIPGLAIKPASAGWELVIPEKYFEGHEAHFASVTKNFLGYLEDGSMPEWEVPNMLCKYYTTTSAYTLAIEKK
jgi:predicted dehydrogenase